MLGHSSQGRGVVPVTAGPRVRRDFRQAGARLLTLLLVFITGSAIAQIKPGDVPPDDLGTDRQGAEVQISAHRGKVVIVTFWASWCAYCLKELPVLDRLQRAAGKSRMEVIAVNYKEDRRDFRAMRRGLKDSALTLTSDPYGSLGDAYGVKGLPHLVMIGKGGQVAHVHTGYGEKTLDRLIEQINRLLVQPVEVPVAGPSAVNPGTPTAV